MRNGVQRVAWPARGRSQALAAALCGCAFLTFTAARAVRLRPGHLQHVICKAPATVPTYSWLSDAPDFAVVISIAGFRPALSATPLPPVLQLAAAPSRLEFSQYVRPPPAV